MLKTTGNLSVRSGDQTILNGNLVIGTAGKGIDFSADPHAAGMTSELLDDYEEGTFTPVFNIGNTAQSADSDGRYVKIGRMVYFQLGFYADPWTESGTGNITISGLPFTSLTEAYSSNFVGCTYFQGTNTTFIFGDIGSNTSIITMKKGGANQRQDLTDADISGVIVLIKLSGSYQTA